METTLPALERVVSRYRRDVNQLAPGATPEALQALEAHLQRPLPADLRRFLALHNGVTLFRAALRVRSTSEMAVASASHPQVVLFADGQAVIRQGLPLGEPCDERWAFADLPSGQTVYGVWDGTRLDVVYGSFIAWLEGEIARIETRVVREEDIDALRREVAPEDVPVLVRAGARELEAGRPEAAEALLFEATRRDPGHARAWQLLGDALAVRDRLAARTAWHRALRRTRLPLSFPGAPCLSPDVLSKLAPPPLSSPAADEEWEHELQRFLTEAVADVADEESLQLVVAVATHLVRSLVRRGRRRAARDVLSDTLTRAAQFRCKIVPWALVLDLVQLEIGLGNHDAAEALLRRVRRQGPRELLGRAHLFIAEIAVLRQEPWAEDALDDALTAGLDEEHKLIAALLRIERAVRHQRVHEALAASEGIERLARRAGVLRLEAWTALVQGDTARLSEQRQVAHAHYQRGLELAAEREPEIRGRLLLRLAELAWSEGRRDEALSLATRGAEIFRSVELPIREAWALVRLASFLQRDDPGRAQQLRAAARERFVEADLAAGVAAVDSLSDEPGASLVWHLERSTAQARARHDAQRARPPWDRSDAERPERRLGAHRLAIAACDTAVATALAREMDACARAASVGRGRPTDPPVLRYVAAVDLLSGHRSYEAARVLLDHLFIKGVDGVMLRALQGAIARSPNAALVDGLLRCVERPGDQPARAVAAAAELLGLRREPAAVKPLVQLAEPSSSPVVRKAAIAALGRIGDRSVAEAIVAGLQDVRLAEQTALALLMLGDRRGVDFHARALVEQRTDLSGSPGEIVGRYGGPDHLLLLMRAAEGEGERALGALQGLGLLGDPRAVPCLLKALQGTPRRILEMASASLSILSGRDDNPDEPGLRARWHDWWDRHEALMPPGVRFRHGERFDCGMLLQRMSEADAYVRRTAYDELVITSGQPLPFDSDGPWRVQQAHLAEWWRWWSTAQHRFPAGRWVLDGQVLA